MFVATITTVSTDRLGIYIPKKLQNELAKYKGKKVIVHIYVTETE